MTLVPPLTAYVPPWQPLTNITPFTYRDGNTYAEELEVLRCKTNDIIDFVNENFEKLGDDFAIEVNKLIEQVNAQLAAQDAAISTQLDNQNEAITEQLAEQNTAVAQSIADLTAYVNAAVASIIDNSAELQDDVMAVLVADTESDTHEAIVNLITSDYLNDDIISDLVENPASATAQSLEKIYGAFVLVTEFGAIGDGTTDNTDAIVAAIAAAEGRTLYFPAGEYRVMSSTRLVIEDNATSIVGDPSGLGTIIRFMNAAGGFDIGNGTDNVYETVFSNIVVSGNGTATTLIRMRKAYEPYFNNARIENCAGTLISMENCGQFDGNRLILANAAVGIETSGTVSPVTSISLANFYNIVDVVKFKGTGISKFALVDSWVEACETLYTVDAAGAFSISEIIANRVKFLKATGNFRLFKFVAASALNAQNINFDNNYINAPASTVPLIDFTAADTNGVVRVNMEKTTVIYVNTGTLLQVNASQVWNNMLVDIVKINGVAAGLWAPVLSLAYARPPVLYGSGVPSISANVGALYQRADTAPGFYPPLYAKVVAGTSGIVWRAIGTFKAISVKGVNYTLTEADEVIISNGTSLTMTLPNPGLNTGRFFTIKNLNVTSATVLPGTGTIDGVASVTLAQNEVGTFISAGTGIWYRI